jgi:glutathione S-transferase
LSKRSRARIENNKMLRLLHHPLDPASRLVRLMCAEYGIALDLHEIKPWRRDAEFLEINPAASLPVLFDADQAPTVGVLAVVHAVEERYAPNVVTGLFPAHPADRAEMWRLVEWVLLKLNEEVTRYILEEKIEKRDQVNGTPDPSVIRVAKANLAEHMNYFIWLCATRHWLAGDSMTLADFALAAHFSTLDYLGDINWDAAGETRDWYARMKSRPAFRTLLIDRVVGMPAHCGYADLDF